MSKRLILVLALAFVVSTSFAAYAGVQNIKVSGDINAIGIIRDGFDLGYGYPSGSSEPQPKDINGSHQRLFADQVRLRVDADLTDNVSATVRLLQERGWGNTSGQVNGTDQNNYNTNNTNNIGINLDLAYITLKEFLYSPLTMTIGRQELMFGNKLIIGNGSQLANGAADYNNLPKDLSVSKAFDAIRATLNYDPLVIDAIYASVRNTVTTVDARENLYGVNVSYDITKKVNLQAYAFAKYDKSNNASSGASSGNTKMNKVVATPGFLLTYHGQNLKASAEAAYQFGATNHAGTTTGAASEPKEVSAFALQLLGDYTFNKLKMKPSIGGGYTWLSGNRGSRGGWDPMYQDENLNNIAYAILPFSNMRVGNVRGSIKPLEDVTLLANYGYYQLDTAVSSLTNQYTNTVMAMNGSKNNLGSALDLTVKYDYTEDVQLGLTYGSFWKGDAFLDNAHSAMQVVGNVKVVF
ncbi:MAG: alginate export family protein [Candidatus Omnitrophica bacterium]|nr:alginate export family protein [Candidatus Omnitrophota bacterium]